ncbi:hypothetical protein BIW11_09797 [Tropilaelaps mercedesae]|uniref:TMEM248/TMEM219 domain-containing protein n=1 Tax=Tropilaelaps mercedesae TaxID=418985 RepID=A0A1V9XIG6_9ACAR|nr:hypothetical protein BIW11_09797 [Tropilaelaps mercedesae]
MRRRSVIGRFTMLCLSPVISVTRTLFSLQPPLLLFTFCLLAFALSMLSMSAGLEDRTLANPDVELDWNEFMARLAQLHYCVLPSKSPNTKSGNTSVSADQPKVQVVDQGKSLAALLPDIELSLGGGGTKAKGLGRSTAVGQTPDEPPQNVTVAVSIRGRFHRDVLTEAMSWHAVATGDMVGSRGRLARVPFQLVMLLWPERPEETEAKNAGERQPVPKSPMVLTEVCLIIQGPEALLPKTRAPSRCYLTAIPPQVTREVKLQRTAADAQGKQGDICTHGVWTSFIYQADPALRVLLSRSDLLLVKERLQRSGLFLLALSGLLLVGAALSQHSSPRRFGFAAGVHQFKIKTDIIVNS